MVRILQSIALCLVFARPAAAGMERAGAMTPLPTSGSDPVFTGLEARYVVTVEAAGARCAVPADFDGDGDLDLVSVSSNDNTVAWYERLSDGSYGPKKMISRASNGARIVTVGDIDQDNKTDVIVASYYDHTVGWFRNLGGAFGNMNMITRTANSAQGVSVADLDNDGDLDVLSASSGDSTIAWYENLGEGGKFCEVKNIVDTEAAGIRTVIAADLDEDGFLDLAAASKDDDTIAWYKNDGQTRFTKIVIDDKARGAYSLVAADVDADGHIDLVTAANMEGFLQENGEGGMVSFYRNSVGSDGSLCNFSKTSVTAGNRTGQNDFDWFVLSVWAGDLDLDGDIDIASASFSLLHEGGISWYENIDGMGNTWARHQIYRTPMSKTGHYIFGADMDGDGDTDLIAVTNGDNKVQILTASTMCDNSSASPREECCRATYQFWNGTACVSCPLGSFVDTTSDAAPSCTPCPTACPRLGLAFAPDTCRSVLGCGDPAEAVTRCDCGQDRFMDASLNTCAACPDGQTTLDDRVRTMADHNMVEMSFLDQTKYSISDMAWVGFNGSRCQIPACGPGGFFNMSTKECASCAAGTYSAGGSVIGCSPCPAGSACPSGTEVPNSCQAGSFSSEGAADCTITPAGFVTPAASMAAPVPCPAGSMAAGPGLRECEPCTVGRFVSVEGQSACASCSAGKANPQLWTTMKQITKEGALVWVYAQGAIAAKAVGLSPVLEGNASGLGDGGCTCDVGARLTALGECISCEVGFDCLGGDSDPLMQPGYHAGTAHSFPPEAFAGVGGEYSIFKCVQVAWCPGGPVGTCAEGRQGIGCGECEEGKTPVSDGKCEACTGGQKLPFVAFCVVLLLALCGVYVVNERTSPTKQRHSLVLVSITWSLLVAAMQQIGVASALLVEWVEPIKSTVGAMGFMNLDLEVLQLGCVAKASPISKYSVNIAVVVVAIVFLCLIHVCFVLLRHQGRFRERMPILLGTIGTLLMIGLISVAHIGVAPLRCISSPNDLSVVFAYPTVICGQSADHPGMLASGIALLMLPCFFVGGCGAVVYQFPSRMSRGDTAFLRSFYFLVVRVRPAAIWYVVVFVTRNLLVAMVPMLPDAMLQVVVLQFLLSSVNLVQTRVFPWRLDVANYLDSFATMAMISFMCCSAFLVVNSDTQAVAAVGTVPLLFIILVSCAIFLYSLVSHLKSAKGKQAFRYSICHHKRDAAAKAKLLQIMLQEKTQQRVFIDSDNLQHLDKLFDIIRSQVKSVIALLTQEMLSRPWCAGEITTAFENGVQVIAVLCSGYTPSTDSRLENIGSFLDLSGTNLMQYGISYASIAKAFQRLRDSDSGPTFKLEEGFIGLRKFKEVVGRILGATEGNDNSASQEEAHLREQAVVLSSDGADDESIATAGILVAKLHVGVSRRCKAGLCNLVDCEAEEAAVAACISQAFALIVVMGRGTLASKPQLLAMAVGMMARRIIIPVALPDFHAPTEAYFCDVLPKIAPWLAEASAAIRAVLACSLVSFYPDGPDAVLSAQAAKVLSLINGAEEPTEGGIATEGVPISAVFGAPGRKKIAAIV